MIQVKAIIDYFVRNKIIFTAYDITRLVRLAVGHTQNIRHTECRAEVIRLFKLGQYPSYEINGTQISIQQTKVDALVYHPDSVDPETYNPNQVFDITKIDGLIPGKAKPVPSNVAPLANSLPRTPVPSAISASANLSRKPTLSDPSKNRFTIPSQLLNGLPDVVYVEYTGDKITVVKNSTTGSKLNKTKRGDIRISRNKAKLKGFADYDKPLNIKVVNGSIVISK